MQTMTPLKEVVDILKESGGEELKLCYHLNYVINVVFVPAFVPGI